MCHNKKNDLVEKAAWRFQGPFDPSGNVRLNLFKGKPLLELRLCAKSYHEAAKTLLEKSEQAELPDYELYPCIYLYRHSLELYLKAAKIGACQYLEMIEKRQWKIEDILNRHTLVDKIPILEEIHEKMELSFDFSEMKELIHDIEIIDGQSMNFRYPITKDGIPLLSSKTSINLFLLAQNLDNIFVELEGIVLFIEDAISNMQREIAENRHELD